MRRLLIACLGIVIWTPLHAHAQAQRSSAEPSGLDKLGFGLGLGFRWNITGPDIVTAASVDANGIVRIDRRANTDAGLMLESHYLALRTKGGGFGLGPFVAIQPGSNEIIAALGAGLMVAWRVDASGRGFGIGVGYAAQPSAKILGPEFQENQPAPTDPDGRPLPIRLQERDKGSLVGLFSVVF